MLEHPGVLAAVLLAAALSPARASEPLTGEQIATVIVGNTLEGLTATGYAYTEYVRPDGAMRGKGYLGAWTIVGDTLCLDYDGTQFDACWGFVVDGTSVIWLKDGVVAGPGMLTPGNPYNL